MSDSEDRELYRKARHLATLAVEEIEDRVQEALRALGDPYLVKAAIDSSRIKSYERLQKKASRFGWTVEQALQTAQDFIGSRIVCDNLQDVRRATDLLKETLSSDGFPVMRIDDYVKKAQEGWL